MVDLKAKPYCLSDEDIAWVEKTIAGMTDEEKAGQLFFDNNGQASDEQLREILRDAEHVVLAADDGSGLVGYAFCEYQRHSGEDSMCAGTTLYLDDLCVDEKQRGSGIGKALYEAVVRHAGETGCHNVTLNVWARNESAMRFYEKMGLQVQKIGMEIVLE